MRTHERVREVGHVGGGMFSGERTVCCFYLAHHAGLEMWKQAYQIWPEEGKSKLQQVMGGIILRAGEITYWVKTLANKPDDLGSISGTLMVGEEN